MPYTAIKNSAHDFLAIVLSDEQCKQLVERDPANLSRYAGDEHVSMDTLDRDLISSLIVEDVLGVGRRWPKNGDGEEAATKFNHEFAAAARSKGYALVAEDWPEAPKQVTSETMVSPKDLATFLIKSLPSEACEQPSLTIERMLTSGGTIKVHYESPTTLPFGKDLDFALLLIQKVRHDKNRFFRLSDMADVRSLFDGDVDALLDAFSRFSRLSIRIEAKMTDGNHQLGMSLLESVSWNGSEAELVLSEAFYNCALQTA